jgi:hypothetical protein
LLVKRKEEGDCRVVFEAVGMGGGCCGGLMLQR